MKLYSKEKVELIKSVESPPAVYKKVFSSQEIEKLIEIEENYSFARLVDRPDSRKTKLEWNSEVRTMITDKIESVLGKKVHIGDLTAHFIKSRFPLRIHSDMGKDPNLIPYKNILIPLYVRGAETTHTILFKQKWYGESSLFSKTITGMSNDYFFKDISSKFVYVEDASDFVNKLRSNMGGVVKHAGGSFLSTVSSIEEIEALLRQKRYSARTDKHITNNKPFDKDQYEKYLTHQPYEDLEGLEIDKIIPWYPGDIITFNRSTIHCASNFLNEGVTEKLAIAMFTIIED